ncbi:MAG: hypothetical protein H7Z42_04015 [Roseiflexaceae bacterium]|nr:hypothetical protein [Roseiflexaceae bacterium]
MKQSTKLFLDLGFGAVLPILVLNFLTPSDPATPTFGWITTPIAYVISALIPVAWVAIDLLFITRKFNFITSYIGLGAIINGALAFWFVDGLLYALKDNATLLVTTLLFAISALLGQPVFRFFFAQAVAPDTPAREASLAKLLREPDIPQKLLIATWLVVLANILVGVINFFLNLNIVTADFGTTEFNQQVAYVNGLTRVILPIPNLLVVGWGFWTVYREIFRHLPSEPDKPQLESDFWELMRLREQ